MEVEAVSEQFYRVEETDDPELSKKVEKADGILQALLQFCQRNSGRMDEKARQVSYIIVAICTVGCCALCDNVLLYIQAMWFPTFDKIHSLQRKYEPAINQVISESKCCLGSYYTLIE